MSTSTPRIGFVSLGCPKALVDSERLLTHLRAEGYAISPTYEGADMVVVNTCGFIDAAVEESLDAIGEALQENGRVIVTGCLGARGDTVRQAHPRVLAVTGPNSPQQVLEAIHRELPAPHDPYTSLVPPHGIRLTPRHYAYLKISEGCNHHCSFCIIPSMRGRLASRPAGKVLEEARRLVHAGVKELLVISQDTSAYGADIGYRPDLWDGRAVRAAIDELSGALGELGAWVRLHYVYPYPHVDRLIPLMAEGRILPYLDVPLQHASRSVLKAMRRPARSGEDTLARIARWRATCPELVLRSTFIVGFPGETEDDFRRLLDFLERAQLDRVGCFAYSAVDGAAANDLPNPVPEPVKEERRARFMEVQEAISTAKLARRIGTRVAVLLDEDAGRDGVATGRSYGEAPEIDGVVRVAEMAGKVAGETIEVEITGADAHDLYARPLRAPA